jgi:hypothetical protein
LRLIEKRSGPDSGRGRFKAAVQRNTRDESKLASLA